MIKVALVGLGKVELMLVSNLRAVGFEEAIAAKLVNVLPSPMTSAIIPPRETSGVLEKNLIMQCKLCW